MMELKAKHPKMVMKNPIQRTGGIDQIQADWEQENQEAVDYIKNKPDIDGINTAISTINSILEHKPDTEELRPVAFSGDYDDLTNCPSRLSDFENDVGFITQGLPDASEFEDGTGLVAIDKKFRTTAGFPYRGKLFDDINWKTPVPDTYLESISDDGVYTFYKISDKVFKTEQLNADTIIVSGQAVGTTQKTVFTKYFYGDGFTSIGASNNASLHQVYNIEKPVDVQTERNGGITHFTSVGLWVKGMSNTYDFTLESKILTIPMGEEFFPVGVPKYNNYFDITQPEDLTPAGFERYEQLVEDGLAFRIKNHPSYPNSRYYFVKFSSDFLDYDTLLNSYYDTTMATDVKISENSFQKHEDGYIGVGGTGYSPFGIISVAESGEYQSWYYADDVFNVPDKGTYCLMTVSAQGTNTHIIHMYKEVIKLDNLFLDTNYINSLIEAKQVQADWNQTDETALDYIKNKPVEPEITTYDIQFNNSVALGMGKFVFTNTEDSPDVICEKLRNGTANINRIIDLTYDPVDSISSNLAFEDYELYDIQTTATAYALFYKRVIAFQAMQFNNPQLDTLYITYNINTQAFNIYHSYHALAPSIIIYTDFEFADQPYPHAIKFSNAGGRWGKTNLASVKNARAGFNSDFNFLLRVTTHGDNVWLRPTETVSANALPRFIGESEKLRKRVVVTFDNWTDSDHPTATMDLQDLIDDTHINGLIDDKLPTARVEKTASDTTASIDPNKLYVFPTMTALNISLNAGDSSVVNEYHFIFTSGTTATNLTLPATVKKPYGFTVEANTTYEVSILENCMVVQRWEA